MYFIILISNQKNEINIKIQNLILTKDSTVKFLGVTTDDNLTFNDHVKNVTTKISKSVGVMRRLLCQLPANIMVKLYYYLVYSQLTMRCCWYGEDWDLLILLRFIVLTGEHANYLQIIAIGSSLFTQFVITLVY